MARPSLILVAPLLLASLNPFSAVAQSPEVHPVVAQGQAELADPAQPFVMVVQFRVVPGKAEAFEAAFAAPLAQTVKEPGNVAYTMCRSAADPNSYLLFERWRSLADLDQHLHFDYLVKLGDALAGVLEEDGGRTITFYQPIGN